MLATPMTMTTKAATCSSGVFAPQLFKKRVFTTNSNVPILCRSSDGLVETAGVKVYTVTW